MQNGYVRRTTKLVKELSAIPASESRLDKTAVQEEFEVAERLTKIGKRAVVQAESALKVVNRERLEELQGIIGPMKLKYMLARHEAGNHKLEIGVFAGASALGFAVASSQRVLR